MKVRFFKCELCGNMVMMVHEGGGQLTCCGQAMTELTANSVDAAVEKHVPAVEVEGNKVTVKVGEVAHPMQEEHYIEWIYVECECCGYIAYLKPGDAPEAVFNCECCKPVAVYAYCNLHGLWKKEL